MRIAILANVPLDPNQGSGYVITGYARELAAAGYQVEMHSAFPKKNLPKGKGNRFRTRMAMRRALTLAQRCDCLLLWGGEAGWIMPKLMSLPARGKVIACSNGLETHVAASYGATAESLVEHPATPCFTLADGLMVVSQFDLDFAERMGYQTAERRIAISNPLPPEFLARNVNHEREPLVLFVGSWIERKGIRPLSTTIQEVRLQQPNVKFRLIGHGVSAAKDLGAETFDPGVPRSDLVHHYSEAAVLVMPSAYESFGMVASEAMACGCAVVATPTGFPYELEDGVEVLHVKHDHSENLTRAILALTGDPVKRASMAHAGYQRVQELTWDTAGRKMKAFIDRQMQDG